MSDWSRRYLAAQKDLQRAERAAVKRQKELEREAKRQAKADEAQRAVIAFQAYEARIEVLRSVHRDCGPTWDWHRVASKLPPHVPRPSDEHELRARREYSIDRGRDPSAERRLSEALVRDKIANDIAARRYAEELSDWEKLSTLARRIVAGETPAYRDALAEFSPLAELADIGSDIDFTMHSRTFCECVLSMNGTDLLPTEALSITSTGKLSTKAMPRQQFHELYQDYICGGVLRIVRESFALLPLESILVTALAPTDGGKNDPVLSVAVSRSDLDGVDFERADASDTIEALQHRGDFKASRKSGAFQAIEPFAAAGFVRRPASNGIDDLIAPLEVLRAEVATRLALLSTDT